MSDLSVPNDYVDLLDTSTALLATLGPGGQPQVTAIWFLYEDGRIKISLNKARQKYKNLLRDPRVSFFILDPSNPQRSLEIRGEVEIADDSDYVAAARVGAKYGADLKAFDAPGSSRVILTLNPTRIVPTTIG
jgi:PPOX class probable F420-dependent enzyme